MTCPHPVDLLQIISNGAGSSCPPDVAAHLEDCPACRRVLEECENASFFSDGQFDPRCCQLTELPQIDGYVVEREIGRGAMGVVYLAREQFPPRHVALKLLPGGRFGSPRERRQWLREAEAASRVRHSNVVTLHQVAELDRWFVLVLEHVPGGTLSDRLSEPIGPPYAARLIASVARAVHHVHLQGLLHLDLKPSNILLDGEREDEWNRLTPKVADFGISRVIDGDATESTGSLAGGTPSYMAPEQLTATKSNVTARADVHGLGAILYHMLTGRPPYHGATPLETIDLVRKHDPIPPRRFNPKIPADLQTICLKCLEKVPVNRYSSAQALADDLDRYVAGLAIAARPISPIERTARWCRRKPAIAALVTTLAVTLSVSFVAVLLLWRNARAEQMRSAADFGVAESMFGDMIYLASRDEDGRPAQYRKNAIGRLQRTRDQLLDFRTRRAGDSLIQLRLAFVEYVLGERLRDDGELADARSNLIHSLSELDAFLDRSPHDRVALVYRFVATRTLASVAHAQGRIEESASLFERAIAAGEELTRAASPGEPGVAELADSRRSLARVLASRGEVERARALLLANRRTLRDVREQSDLTGLAVGGIIADIEQERVLAGSSSSHSFESSWGEFAIHDRLRRLASREADSMSAETWAEVVDQAMHANPGYHMNSAQESKSSLELIGILGALAAHQRHSGHIDVARTIADRAIAIAHKLIARCPDLPAAHLALSLALTQAAKNAWQTEDHFAIERNLNVALAEARHAVSLDPQDGLARAEVAELQRRLTEFVASK